MYKKARCTSKVVVSVIKPIAFVTFLLRSASSGLYLKVSIEYWSDDVIKMKFGANCLWNISPVMLWRFSRNPSKFGLVHKIRNQVRLSTIPDNLPQIANFWRVGVLDVVLSEYLNKSHNFTNFIFYDVTLRYSIACGRIQFKSFV